MQNPRRPLLHNMGWHFVLLDGIVKLLMSENLAEEADQRIPASHLGIHDFTSICFLSSSWGAALATANAAGRFHSGRTSCHSCMFLLHPWDVWASQIAYETLAKFSRVRWHWFPENRKTSRPLWRVLFALAGFDCGREIARDGWKEPSRLFNVPPDWWWSLGKRATSSGQWGNTEMALPIFRFWHHDPVEISYKLQYIFKYQQINRVDHKMHVPAVLSSLFISVVFIFSHWKWATAMVLVSCDMVAR